MTIRVKQYLADGLGDSSYLVVDDERKVATVIDPQRDVWRYLDEAARDGCALTHSFDTHVHNDFVSGSFALQEFADTRVVAGAGANFSFAFHSVRDGESIEVGGITLTALHTPGHTPEHMSYALATRDGGMRGIFTGGSLIVGSAGRTDLLGAGETELLTRLQRGSLRRLAGLPADLPVYPTHGQGSFCSAQESDDGRTTTIGRERAQNAAVRVALDQDEDAFVRHQLRGLPAYPAYYAHMAPLNRRGAPSIGARLPELTPVDPHHAFAMQERGTLIVDARRSAELGDGYPRGATAISLGDSFASYVGWVLPFNAELLLVLPSDREARRAHIQLFRIGFDRCAGFVAGGFNAWRAAGLPQSALDLVDLKEARDLLESGRVLLLDVRQDHEWAQGHVPGAVHVPVGELPRRLGDIPDGRPVMTMCASGLRATMAATIIRRVGMEPKAILGGVGDWRARGWPLESET